VCVCVCDVFRVTTVPLLADFFTEEFTFVAEGVCVCVCVCVCVGLCVCVSYVRPKQLCAPKHCMSLCADKQLALIRKVSGNGVFSDVKNGCHCDGGTICCV